MDDRGSTGPLLVRQRFVGRSAELATLQALSHEVEAGTPWLVVIQGESGIGKSALLRQLPGRLETFNVLRAACDETETDLPFGVVGQLASQLAPDQLADSPLLEQAQGSLPSYTVGADLLALLGRLQQFRPVALLIDDITLADRKSLEAMQYAQRRMLAERVLIVATARTEPGESISLDRVDREGWRGLVAGERVRTIELPGLTPADVLDLLAAGGTGHLSTSAREKLWQHTRGHPLYLNAVLAELSADQLEDPLQAIPVSETLSASVRHRMEGLPLESRHLLEALAVLGTRTSLAVAGQLAELLDPTEALGPALESGLAAWASTEPTTPIWISHPMIRDAIETMLTPTRRKLLHAAAAAFVDEKTALRHRVAASDLMNETLAGELEQRAFGQLRLGNAGQAATWLEWASHMSANRPDRERRLLTSAGLLLIHPRDESRAFRLKSEIEACTPSPVRIALLARLKRPDDPWATAADLQEAIDAGLRSPEHALHLGMTALYLCGCYLALGRGAEAIEAAELGVAYSPDPNVQRYAAALVSAGISMSAGPRAGLHHLGQRFDLPPAGSEVTPDNVVAVAFRGLLSVLAGEPTAGVRDMEITLQMMLAGIGLGLEEDLAHFLAMGRYLQGHWTEATIRAEQTVALNLVEGRSSSRSRARLSGCLLAAGRGDWDEADEHLRKMDEWTAAPSTSPQRIYWALASAAIAQAHADYHGMLVLEPYAQLPPPNGYANSYQAYWLPLYVEGLLGTGRLDDASVALGRLSTLEGEVPNLGVARAWLEAWALAASGDVPRARAMYDAALQVPAGPDDSPLHRASLAHGYGRLLIPGGEPGAAAPALTEAARIYTAMGARPFLERVTADLAKTGAIPASRKIRDLQLDLTGRERQIAVLVARGLSNDEAAHELYLSTKTVEYHLSHVYTKLGIKGRRELRDRLGDAERIA